MIFNVVCINTVVNSFPFSDEFSSIPYRDGNSELTALAQVQKVKPTDV